MDQLLKFKKEGILTEVAFEVFKKLIKEKQEEDMWRSYRNRYGSFMIFVVYPAFLYLLYRLDFGNSREIAASQMIQLVANHFVWMVAIILYLTHHLWFWLNKKLDEAEDDCDELRMEVIDRMGELLSGESWSYRDRLFSHLKKEFDINMYTKS